MKSSLTALLVIMSFETSWQILARYYEIESLLDSRGRKPYNLNVHKKTNTLFFCYNVSDPQASQFAYLNIDSREYRTILGVGIRQGCAYAIDQERDVIYLGGNDGIYKYNMYSDTTDYYMEKGVYIWSMYYNKRLFYISYPDQKIYTEFQGQFARIEEFDKYAVDNFLIDRAGYVYFTDRSKVYLYDKHEGEWHVKDLKNASTKQISQDNEGVVYICTSIGVFTVSKNGLKKVMNERNIFGIASDRDNNLILANAMNIFRLQSGIDVYVVEHKSQNHNLEKMQPEKIEKEEFTF